MTPQIALRWQLLALIVLIGFAFYLLAPVLTPFAVAAMFAYLFDPLADRLERWKLSRSAAVAIVFLGLTLLLVLTLVLLVPFLERQVANFILNLPKWTTWLQTVAVPWANERFHTDIETP